MEAGCTQAQHGINLTNTDRLPLVPYFCHNDVMPSTQLIQAVEKVLDPTLELAAVRAECEKTTS